MLCLMICKYFHELLHTFTLIFCQLIEGRDIVCQLYFRIVLINEQKMFPHTHVTFSCALVYRNVFSMKKCLVLNLEAKVKM